MKKLSQLLVTLLFLLCLNSQAQTNGPNDSRIAPLLKQAAAGQPELVISGRDNASRYVNMAILDKSRKMLTWFTCYGSAFDSAQLTDVEYNYIVSKAVTPYDFYKQFCLENIAYLEDAESHFRQFGKDALKDTTHNRQVVYSSPAVKLAPSTLQKVLAMESLLKKQCLQLTLFNSESPSHVRRNDTFLLRKSLAGKMARKNDTTTYYNTYLLGAVAKIALCKHAPEKMFVYNRQEQVIDSVPLKPEKYASLLKEKEDVFLLYRGWLELQSQQVLDARRQVSGLLSAKDASLFTQTKLQEDHQKALWHSMLELEQQQLAIEQKISNLLMPDPQTVKSMLRDAYPDAPSEVSYLEGLGFAYTTSYTRGQKVYELTDHRGNVMATVSDKKKGIDENQDGVIEYYNADVVNANDYYPFGMLEPGRSYSADSKYRYGYNGKENDNEVKGEGNQQDYGMRIYDPRLGRFLSVDPLTSSYPFYTPYQFAGNKPIQAVDLDGLEEWMMQQSFALKRKAEIKIAHAEQIARDNTRIPEPQILLPDVYGVGHIGPESKVKERVAYINNQHSVAVGEAIAGGPFGAAGYLIQGDNGAFKGAAVDQVLMSFGGIPAENSNVFPKRINIEPVKSVPYTENVNSGSNRMSVESSMTFSTAMETSRKGLSFNEGVLEGFAKHAFANDRHSDLGLSVETMASKGINLVEQYIPLLKTGDNTLIGNINGIQKSFKAFVKDGKIMSVNMYPGASNRTTQGTVINYGNVKW